MGTTLLAMLAPTNQATYNTIDGTPYRGDDAGIVYVLPQHVGELTGYGFTAATAAQVPVGDPLTALSAWSDPNAN